MAWLCRLKYPYAGVGREVITVMWSNGGDWYWGVAMMVVFWGAIVAIVYFAFRGRAGDGGRPSARELLDARLAKGELSEEEYGRKRAAIEDRGPDDSI